MLFNSLPFIFFFVIVFTLYWSSKDRKLQNILLLCASYFFYGWWDPRFVFLLAFSTLLDFFTGLKIYNSPTPSGKRMWLLISLVINLGFLFVFKYYNFFITEFGEMLQSFGLEPHFAILKIVLPVGISFYTFHGISYIVDIYNGKAKPTSNIIDYSVFVSFFPLLVAGPIERANHLLPQIQRPREFNYSSSVLGLREILWGLFKKVVVADTAGMVVDSIFNNYDHHNGSTLALGVFLFAIQIYGDFSGYSDIARGVSRLMGFELIRNFSYPYFSRDIAEFWRRWHISLSSWFRDYVYIPLGGSKGSKWLNIRNVFIIFLLSGFWHGANWTFLMWGALNALYFLPLLLTNRNRANLDIVAAGRMLPSFRDAIAIVTTFCLTTFAWIFFRAESIEKAFGYVKGLFSMSLLSPPEILPKVPLLLIFAMITIEWFGREHDCPLQFTARWPVWIRWILYFALIGLIFLLHRKHQSFIYFQF